MSKRFDGLQEYEYLGLLNQEKFEYFHTSFPTRLVKMHVSQNKFDEAKLSNKLKVLYSRNEFRDSSVARIMSLIAKKN